MQKITPFLWFDNQAEEAANFYVAVFSARAGNSRINSITRYDAAGAEASGRPAGSVMTVEFLLSGQEFAMNPNVSWIVIWQWIVRPNMPYLTTVLLR
jgi:predicted 3-demethylubiquinone-9 3-methyltransferase (glyoxalase superfamily)